MKVILSKIAAKSLDKIPDKFASSIVQHLQSLAKNPHPPGSIKLTGSNNYRFRVGVYRVIYWINSETITILRIAHRKEVYQ